MKRMALGPNLDDHPRAKNKTEGCITEVVRLTVPGKKNKVRNWLVISFTPPLGGDVDHGKVLRPEETPRGFVV